MAIPLKERLDLENALRSAEAALDKEVREDGPDVERLEAERDKARKALADAMT